MIFCYLYALRGNGVSKLQRSDVSSTFYVFFFLSLSLLLLCWLFNSCLLSIRSVNFWFSARLFRLFSGYDFGNRHSSCIHIYLVGQTLKNHNFLRRMNLMEKFNSKTTQRYVRLLTLFQSLVIVIVRCCCCFGFLFHKWNKKLFICHTQSRSLLSYAMWCSILAISQKLSRGCLWCSIHVVMFGDKKSPTPPDLPTTVKHMCVVFRNGKRFPHIRPEETVNEIMML